MGNVAIYMPFVECMLAYMALTRYENLGFRVCTCVSGVYVTTLPWHTY